MTRPEPRCLVTTATGQSPRPWFTLGDRSNPPRGDEVVCSVGIREGWRGKEVQMGTITHRGGKIRRPCPTFAPRPPTDLLIYPRLFNLYCFVAICQTATLWLILGSRGHRDLPNPLEISYEAPLGSQRSASTTRLVFI